MEWDSIYWEFDKIKNITTEEYFNNNSYAVDVFLEKYSHNKENGNKETPGEVFYRVASKIHEYDKSSSEILDKWFSLMYDGWFRPGGSILSSVGGGRNISTGNCSTIPIEDDTIESICKAEKAIMKCAAYRQGLGIDLSPLRPRGALLGNAANKSTGVIPWGEKYSNVGLYVGQEGRMPAVLLSLLVNHPDIFEFINSKRKMGKIENANISVQITNDFMECLKNEEKWKLKFETHRETIEYEVDPEDIINEIAEAAAQSAEPGVQYINMMQKASMTHSIYKATGNEKYKIISTNACAEKPMCGYSLCNLGSINMEKFSTQPKEYKEQLKEIVPLIVRFLDCVVDYEFYESLSPIEQQAEIIKELRQIGCGITNVHGWFLKQDLQYDSDEAIEKLEDFMKWYSYYVFKSSVELGEEKGNAPVFNYVNIKDLMESSYFKNMVNTFYDGDPKKIKTLRNIELMSIAPTGSLSNSFSVPCISSGIEPIIGPYYWRKTRVISKGVYDFYFIIPERVREHILKFIPENSEDYEKINNFSGSVLDNDGKIGLELKEIIERNSPPGLFKAAHEIDYNKKIELLGHIYKWIDASISCSFNLPKKSTVEDVKKIYLDSYEKGVRAVSVYREGSREGILIFEDPKTHEKMTVKNSICSERPEDIIFTCAPKRPKELSCNIHHCSVRGEKWLVIIGMLNDSPYELFAGEQEDIYLPKSCKEGIIRKTGSGKYELNVTIRRSEVEYKDIAHALMDNEQRALTRMLSLSIRHGVPLEFIIDQLKKADGNITDFSAVVSRVLSSYAKSMNLLKGDKCPICGEVMVREESCVKCFSCNYSKC